MEGLRWSKILLQWVKESNLVTHSYETIEQCNVDEFYQQFCKRMESTIKIKEPTIIDFLKEHFPHYELYLTESGQIAAPDHFYIFSLLLYFSCVKHTDRYFQQICNRFDKPQQYAVTVFLKSMLEGSRFRKEIDRMMIQKSIQDAMPNSMLPPTSPPAAANDHSTAPPAIKWSAPSSLLSSDISDSPVRMKNGQPKISPPTPKTVILDERTKQLKELKAQLEAERYEKGYLEVQLKQLQDKNDRLLECKRSHLKEIRELKAELATCNRENISPNKQRESDGKVARIERQLHEKEEMLDRIKLELETANESNKHATEMINYRNVQIIRLKDRISELESSITTLSECIDEKEEIIRCLRESNDDLQNFIAENRLQRDKPKPENLNISFECIELSSATSSVGSGNNCSPENMAQAVVDVQLKEREAENALLKRSLEIYEQEKVRVSCLIGQFFRLYSDLVGKLPHGNADPNEVGFVEKMTIFKCCYEKLYEEYGKYRETNQALEVTNQNLEQDLQQLQGELTAVRDVLRKLEIHSAEIENELTRAKQSAAEYKRHGAQLEEDLLKNKRGFLKLISDNDKLQKRCDELERQNLDLNVEFNSLKGEYDSISQKIDYLMLTLNDDYEASDFSSWFEKMDSLRERLQTLKEDNERLISINMKITVEKIALQKDITIGEENRQQMQLKLTQTEEREQQLMAKMQHTMECLEERNETLISMESFKVKLEENIQSLSDEVVQRQSQLEETLDALKRCEESLESAKEQHSICEEELSSVKQNNGTLQSSLNDAQCLLRKLEHLQAETLADKDQLQQSLGQLEGELQAKVEELAKVSNDYNALYEQHHALLVHKVQIEHEKDELAKKISSQTADIQNHVAHIDRMEKELANFEKSLADEVCKMEQQECSWNEKLSEKETHLAIAEERNSMLNNVTRSLLDGFSFIERRAAQLKGQYDAKIDELQDKLHKFSTLLTTLSAQQCKLRLEKSALQDKFGQFRQQYDKLQEENQLLIEANQSLKETVQLTQAEKHTIEEQRTLLESKLAAADLKLQQRENKVNELAKNIAEIISGKEQMIEENYNQIAERNMKLEQAAATIQELQETLSTIGQTRIRLEQEINEKIEQLRDVTNDRNALQSKCLQLENDLQESREHANSNLREKLQLEEQLAATRTNLFCIETAQTHLEQELITCRTAIEDKGLTVVRLSEEKATLEQKIQDLMVALDTVRAAKASLQDTLDQEQEKSEELEGQVVNLNAKFTTVVDELSQLAEEREELLAAQELMLKEKEELEAKLEELNERFCLAEEDRDTLREEKCRLEAEMERIDYDKEGLDQQCGKLLGELAKQKLTLQALQKSYDEKATELEQDRNQLETKLQKATEESKLLSEKVEQLEHLKVSLESQLSDKAELQRNLAQLQTTVDTLGAEKSELTARNSDHVAEQIKNLQRITELSRDLEAYEENKQKLQGQISSLEVVKRDLEERYEDLSAVCQDAKEKILIMEAKIDTLLQDISSKEVELTEKDIAVKKYQENVTNLDQILAIKLEELKRATSQISEKDEMIQTLSKEKEQLILLQSHSLEATKKEQLLLSEQLTKTCKEKDELSTELGRLSQQLENCSSELTLARQQVAMKEQEILAVEQSLAASEANCVGLTQQLEETNAAQILYVTQLESLKENFSAQQETLGAKQKDLEDISGQLEQVSKCRENLRQELNQARTVRLTLEERIQELNQQITSLQNEHCDQKATIETKDFQISQLTEGLEQSRADQHQLETKVAELEQIATENKELEVHLDKLQHELDTIQSDRQRLTVALEKMAEEKQDIDRRLIQQLQDYDTLNEAFLTERDLAKDLEQKQQQLAIQMQTVMHEKDHLLVANDGLKTQLAAKEKRLLDQEKQMEKLKNEIENLFGKNQQLDSLTRELMTLKVEKAELHAKIDELLETVDQKDVQEKGLRENMGNLREALKAKQSELDSLHADLSTLKETLHNMKIENGKLTTTKEIQQDRVLSLELKTSEQSKKLEQLESALNKTEISHLEDNSKAAALLKEVEKYKAFQTKFKEMNDLHVKQCDINKQLQQHVNIMKVKLTKARNTLEENEKRWNDERLKLIKQLDSVKDAEDKIKDIRSDYERKLEKMKDKMASLYKEMKAEKDARYEKTCLDHKSEYNQLESRVVKLQQQIGILNQSNLDLKKENEFMKSKIRIMDNIKTERKSMAPPNAHRRLCANLKMEDEEGEVFNTTYLTDLKAGRTSPFKGRGSVQYSELAMRNSMVPPHLKSSYLPQYTDGDLTDEDNRDATSTSLDDSSTSLITRKKAAGTSYKRPGPPTPSKKAGRISFGGSLPTNDFQYKEILKDNSNHGSTSSSAMTLASRLSFGSRKGNTDGRESLEMTKYKTPGKFKQMTSTIFNGSKDEVVFHHQAMFKINCQDDTESASSGREDKTNPIRLRRSERPVRRQVHVRKMIARFDANRRLSNMDSDSPGSSSPRNSGDPYGGFSYDGTSDMIKKIDINSMSVFKRKERQATPSLVVFRGDTKDTNNNQLAIEGPARVSHADDLDDTVEGRDMVQRMCNTRRDKLRRRSRDRRQEFFNALRNIDGDAIVFRSEQTSRLVADDGLLHTSQTQFESLAMAKELDRPSEILPRSGRLVRQPHSKTVMHDRFDEVVTSSTSIRTVASVPLLERFSELFRVATLQNLQKEKEKHVAQATIEDRPLQSSTDTPDPDQTYATLLFFTVLSFSALLFSVYFHYVNFRISKTN